MYGEHGGCRYGRCRHMDKVEVADVDKAEVANANKVEVADADKRTQGSIVSHSHIASENTSFF